MLDLMRSPSVGGMKTAESRRKTHIQVRWKPQPVVGCLNKTETAREKKLNTKINRILTFGEVEDIM